LNLEDLVLDGAMSPKLKMDTDSASLSTNPDEVEDVMAVLNYELGDLSARIRRRSIMRARVVRPDPIGEFETEERCFILEVSNDDGDGDVSIARARVHSGVTTEWHLLKGTDERYLVTRGRGRVDIEGIPSEDVAAGDVVRIPANTPQRITNTGNEDLVFYCICNPRFSLECYVGLPGFGDPETGGKK